MAMLTEKICQRNPIATADPLGKKPAPGDNEPLPPGPDLLEEKNAPGDD